MCVCVEGGRGERQTEAERFEELTFWGYNSVYINEITATWFSCVCVWRGVGERDRQRQRDLKSWPFGVTILYIRKRDPSNVVFACSS